MATSRKTITAIIAIILCITVSAICYRIIYPELQLEAVSGNISAKYIPKLFVKTENAGIYPDYSETELFDNADYVFSGQIKNIRTIKINYDKTTVYKSLITIDVDKAYKGAPSETLVIYAPPIGMSTTPGHEFLHTLKKNDYGIFLANAVHDGDTFTVSGCSFNGGSICDAMFADGDRFGFIRDDDDAVIRPDAESENKLFPSLTDHSWSAVEQYVSEMTESPSK